jgi:RNA polymerase sigma-70 factor (ECF subfamily)
MGEAATPNQDDASLIARAQAGEVEAFGVLYERYFDLVFRYLRTRISDDREAEDISAGVFLRAFQALGRYRERGWRFSAFLYSIARNSLVDHFRRHREEIQVEDLEGALGTGGGLDEELGSRESLYRLREMLAALPSDYQEVIRLRVILGMSTTEVARWMRRSEGAVRVLLHRALRAARKWMVENDEG